MNSGVDDQILAQVINGISQRKFKKAAAQIPSVFGLEKSSVSRKFIKATAAKLEVFRERDLSSYDIIAIFMDGKSFGENEMIIVLGMTLSGEKIILGTIESSTENARVYRDFLLFLCFFSRREAFKREKRSSSLLMASKVYARALKPFSNSRPSDKGVSGINGRMLCPICRNRNKGDFVKSDKKPTKKKSTDKQNGNSRRFVKHSASSTNPPFRVLMKDWKKH